MNHKDTVIIVDPFSTGALLAPEYAKRGLTCYAVRSSATTPASFLNTYSGAGFVNAKLFSVDDIKKQLVPSKVLAVLPGAETGIYCAEQLAGFYQVAQYNDPDTTDWRRHKSAMQARLAAVGLAHIATRRISADSNRMDELADLDSETGYVIKPDHSCGTDDVVFVANKQEALSWLAQIDWHKLNFAGQKNDVYLVQERLAGEEFVVDLVADHNGLKICSLCRYRKGLHNHSHFVYECLDVLAVDDVRYASIIDYAKKAATHLGVQFGAAHLEIMLTARGPVLIELGARMHGGIAPLVFEQCYESGLLQSMGDLLTGQMSTLPAVLKRKARIIFLINENKDFVIKDKSVLTAELLSINTVNHVQLFYGQADTVPLTTNLLNCPGIVSLMGDTVTELDEAERQVRAVFRT